MRKFDSALLGLTIGLLAAPSAWAQDEEMELLDEELTAEEMALLEELEGEAENTFAPSLRMYGFMDFTVGTYFTGGTSWEGFFNSNTDLYVGNVNLYFEGELSPQWKSLVEVRFLFLPQGTPDGGSPLDIRENPWFSAVAADYADLTRDFNWGGIELERAHIDYTPFGFLRFRVGRFLTPYGVWNVDHGSPVIVSTRRPFLVGQQLFPERQTGFEVFGSYAFKTVSIDYHLTLSNGRGPLEAYGDLDENKAIGGRLKGSALWFGNLEVGVSAYYGDSTDARTQVDPTTITTVPTLEFVDFERFTEFSFGADLRWKWQGILVQSEFVWNERAYDDAARRLRDAPNGLEPDFNRFGVYGLLGYQLPFIPLMPYVLYQYYEAGTTNEFGSGFGATTFQAVEPGLYARILPNVVLKTGLGIAFVTDAATGSPGEDPLYRWESQVAVAF